MPFIRTAALFLLAVAVTGCSSIQPWVKPYERAALADEVMARDRDPLRSEYSFHVREVREASHGATGGAGGGCGCL